MKPVLAKGLVAGPESADGLVTGSQSGINLERLDVDWSLPDRAYDAMKRAIMAMRIYDGQEELRLDERRLAHDLGISRTPVREALLRLQHEGLVRTVPRRGVFVVRKSKAEIVEVVLASAALEGMAGRLAASRASDAQIASVRTQFDDVIRHPSKLDLEQYSALNLQFHQYIVDLAHSEMLSELVETLKIHMRAIRARTMGDGNRMKRSPVEHQRIVEALEARDADALEREIRHHGISLADHVERFVDYLD
ncbi:MAG: GntR family transcriptional regulator [Candidatus Dormiibacterota bacterium]